MTVGIVPDYRTIHLRVAIKDDGQGFDPDAPRGHRGKDRPRLRLTKIRERLSLLAGSMMIEANPGSGTTLFVHVSYGAAGVEV